ncbi:MAG: type II toxin-antitoxin system VapB family antitoxin, partial [Bryobacteraceae bacterium]|nr:type II toxin-antitoxin system VapB family antitoxin [Bryobacteraceae bacterium]
MSLNIKQPRAHELAAQLAKLTGETLTTAVVRSLEERLEREEKKKRSKEARSGRIQEFLNRYSHQIP